MTKNEEYWNERSLENVRRAEDSYLSTSEYLVLQYQLATQILINRVNDFYASYDLKDPYDIYMLLDDEQLQEFKKEMKNSYGLITENRVKNQLQKIRKQKQLQRIESLLLYFSIELDVLYGKIERAMGDNLQYIYQDTYYRSTFNIQKGFEIGYSFNKPNKNAIEKVMSERWLEKNYSDKVWENKSKLVQTLRQEVPQSFIMGENPRVLAKKINNKMGYHYEDQNTGKVKSKGNLAAAERLAQTEYLHIENEAFFDAMEESKVIERYKFLATLDYRTSEICRGMDGKIFKLSQKKVGINFPPLHPRCRSTTIPYFDDDIIGTRIARGIDNKSYYVQGDMTYQEWAKKYSVDAQMPEREKERRIQMQYRNRWEKMSKEEQKEAMRRFNERMGV